MLPRPPTPHSTFLLGAWPGAGGLTLSTFRHSKSEAPWTVGREGAADTEAEPPAPGQRQWRKPGGRVLQLCIHYKLKTLSPHSCSSALPGLTVESRIDSHADPAVATVQSCPSFPLLCGPLVTRPMTVSEEQAALQSRPRPSHLLFSP